MANHLANRFRFFSVALILLAIFGTPASAQKKNKALQKSAPFVLGKIYTIHSNILNENRTLNVYFPEEYQKNDSISYPVIYLLDGSADEDFIHIAGLVQFLTFPWVKILPPSIVVGIANVDRRRDFTFPTTIAEDKKQSPTSGESAKFIEFMQKELQPFVEKSFCTTTSKTLVGQSLGGLLAAQVLFEKPALFTKYVIISPSLWWNNESLLTVKTAGNPPDSLQIYIGVGKEGDIMVNDAHSLENKIKSCYSNAKVYFQYFPGEDHGTILHKAAYDAFETFHNQGKGK